MSAAQAAFTIIIAIDFIFYFFLFLSLSAFCDKRPQLCCYRYASSLRFRFLASLSFAAFERFSQASA